MAAEEPKEEGSPTVRRYNLLKGKRKARGPSEERPEEAVDDEHSEEWLTMLQAKAGADLRDAFSLKACTTKEIRQLPDEAYLGGQRRVGALPIFDLQGKVSLQFLLASYKALEKSRSKLRGESELDLHRPFLRFLMCKARELRLLSSKEVKRGALSVARVDSASKSGQWRLSLEQNQAEASDEEGRQLQEERRAQAAQLEHLEVRFPEKKSSEGETPEILRERLRSQFEAKKARLERHSSDGMDLQSMSDRLTAPSLSFDWHEPDEDGLQVELPERAKTIEGRRALLHDELRRSVSFKQAQEFAKAPSLPSLQKAATPVRAKRVKSSTVPEKAPDTKISEEAALQVTQLLERLARRRATADAVDMKEASPAEKPSETCSLSLEPPETDARGSAGSAPVDHSDELKGAADEKPQGDELSPTLPFEPLEPRVEEPPQDRGDELSPTLPFDINMLEEEAAKVERQSTPAIEAPSAAGFVSAQAPAPAPPPEAVEELQEPSSSEDEELKGDAKAQRERAWLRHKRQIQDVQSQEDDLSFVARPRVKRSILRG